MKSVLSFSAFCGLAVLAMVSIADATSMNDIKPELRQGAECMLRTLKSVPGIDDAEIGVSDTGGWSHPFIQYRAPSGPDGYRATIRFEATKSFYSSSDRKPFFIVSLSEYHRPAKIHPLTEPERSESSGKKNAMYTQWFYFLRWSEFCF